MDSDLVGEEMVTLEGSAHVPVGDPRIPGYGACADFQSDA